MAKAAKTKDVKVKTAKKDIFSSKFFTVVSPEIMVYIVFLIVFLIGGALITF